MIERFEFPVFALLELSCVGLVEQCYFNFCLADTMGKECNKTTEHKVEEIERALSAI